MTHGERWGRPNLTYNCTSGPNGTQCRRCEREGIRAVNKIRSRAGHPPVAQLPPLTQQEITESRRNPCPCDACTRNRKRAAKWRERVKVTDDELDRRALERWDTQEWGGKSMSAMAGGRGWLGVKEGPDRHPNSLIVQLVKLWRQGAYDTCPTCGRHGALNSAANLGGGGRTSESAPPDSVTVDSKEPL